jgi:hypothetical protein
MRWVQQPNSQLLGPFYQESTLLVLDRLFAGSAGALCYRLSLRPRPRSRRLEPDYRTYASTMATVANGCSPGFLVHMPLCVLGNYLQVLFCPLSKLQSSRHVKRQHQQAVNGIPLLARCLLFLHSFIHSIPYTHTPFLPFCSFPLLDPFSSCFTHSLFRTLLAMTEVQPTINFKCAMVCLCVYLSKPFFFPLLYSP